MKKVKLRATASKPQTEFVNTKAKFPAFVAGYGSGKTQALIYRAMHLKLLYPKVPFAYYLPTYDLVKMIAYPRFEEQLDKMKVRYSINKSDHILNMKGFDKIYFRTLDRPEKIVGYQVGHSFVDELDTLKMEKAKECWKAIVERNRFNIGAINTVAVATTPEGFRFVYERWGKKKSKNYKLIKASTYSNLRNLPEDYIETLLEMYPEELISAYINGEFVNLTAGQVYTSFNRERNDTYEEIEHDDILHIGVDFNIGKMSGVVHVIREDENGNECYYALDEFHGLQDTNHLIKAICERYPDHTIWCYPDASSSNRKTQDISKTDFTLLKNAFDRVIKKKSNPLVQDRVNSLNALLFSGNQVIRYFVSVAKCPELVECFEQQVYNNGIPDKTRGKDHMLDASGYFGHAVAPIKRNTNYNQSEIISLGF